MRTTEKINRNWFFLLDDADHTAQGTEGFETLNLPHDWSNDYAPDETAITGGGGGYAKAGIGWYKKVLEFGEICPNEKISLYFEGVYMDSTVYVNGVKAGGHGYGYSSFYVDITDLVKAGSNEISVRVNNALAPNSRWYSGCGIQRDVYLVRTEKVHFAEFGVRACTNRIYPKQNCSDQIFRAMVQNDSDQAVHAGVTHRLLDAEGNQVSISGIAIYLESGECSDCTTRPTVENPHLWSDEDPYLYTLVSTLTVDGVAVDENVVKYGIRTATFDPQKGFLLNGETVKIKGMCVHHDCGLTGAVGYRESWERRLKKLKEMGCNGIRCSHNPPVPVLLDLCDELGFLVMDEAFDEWFLAKNKTNNYYSEQLAYGSSMFFEKHAKEDLTIMLRRDFNHPSVIIWSIGNEIPEQSSADGVKILKYLQDTCHEEDPSRMVTSACDNIVAVEPIRTNREFENALDVVGYNYAGRWRERAETFYEEDKFEFPDRCMIGTENGSAGGTRADYSYEGHFGNYVSASIRHEPLWRYTASHDFVSGDFLWTGIDYLGETRWPRRGAGSGPIDSAGFEKDTYYYFRSIWNNKDITLHLAPMHWNFAGEEGQYRPVVCYTNCDEVKLYINDKYVGSRGYECPRYGCTKSWLDNWGKRFTTNDLHLTWDVVYEPGVLRAEGYKGGKLVAETTVSTTGEMTQMKLAADRTEIAVDGLSQIEISALDSEGRNVYTACPMISCEIEGPAHLVGMDGGDLTDLSLYKNPSRKMFHGLLLAVIQADAAGEVKVTFTAENGLKETMTIQVQ